MSRRIRLLVALLAAMALTMAASAAGPETELAAGDDVVMTLDGADINLFAPSEKPRVLWFWGPY